MDKKAITKRGLLVEVYRGTEGCDCTNNGISARHNQLVLTGEGIPEIFLPNEKTPEVKLIKRNICGKEIIQCTDAKEGFGMFGGNFIYTCDSRFPADYPIKIMDRYE